MKTVIISGYFNPLHGGQIDLIEGARALGENLVVVVNNDKQQMLKKGKILQDERSRVRVMSALRDVDAVVLAVDDELTISKTLEAIATGDAYKNDELIFANGGDRDSEKDIPEDDVCKRYDIEMVFGVGV